MEHEIQSQKSDFYTTEIENHSPEYEFQYIDSEIHYLKTYNNSSENDYNYNLVKNH